MFQHIQNHWDHLKQRPDENLNFSCFFFYLLVSYSSDAIHGYSIRSIPLAPSILLVQPQTSVPQRFSRSVGAKRNRQQKLDNTTNTQKVKKSLPAREKSFEKKIGGANVGNGFGSKTTKTYTTKYTLPKKNTYPFEAQKNYS